MFILRRESAASCLVVGLLLLAVQGCAPLPPGAIDELTGGSAPGSLVVFGDSLSDTGNFKRVNPTDWDLAFGNYDDGRITCGADSSPPSELYTMGVWHEVLMRPPLGIPSLQGITNYAFAGATTGPGVHAYVWNGLPTNALISDLGDQIDRFLSSGGGVAPGANIYVVWAGGNDLIDAAEAAKDAGEAGFAAAIRNASLEAFENARGEVRRLASTGATRIIWGNLPPLYATPWAARSSAHPGYLLAVLDAVTTFNSSLSEAIPSLEAEFLAQGLTIYELDAESLFNNIVLDAFANGGREYGITNFLDIASDLAPDSDAVDSYLFWDRVHPTSHAHAIVGRAVHELLLPSAIAKGP